MIKKREPNRAQVAERAPAFDDLHHWVTSLPWVVERTASGVTPSVRSFEIDCEPLGRKRLWLLTGLRQRTWNPGDDVAVVLPLAAAVAAEEAGLGRRMLRMPGGNALVTPYGDAPSAARDVEALLLCGYSHAMS